MNPKLHIITYNRRKPVDRFVLQCQPWREDAQTLVGFDVTELMKDALVSDHKKGYDALEGPAYHHEVIRALEAGKTHVRVSGAWIASVKQQDSQFRSFVESHLYNTRSSVEFFDNIHAFRRKQHMDDRRINDIKDVDVLDFRPMIGYKGIWKNFRKEYVNIKKTYDYGTIIRS